MWVTYKRIGGSLSSERSNHYISNPKSENVNWILEIRQSNLRFRNLGSQTQDSSNFEISVAGFGASSARVEVAGSARSHALSLGSDHLFEKHHGSSAASGVLRVMKIYIFLFVA